MKIVFLVIYSTILMICQAEMSSIFIGTHADGDNKGLHEIKFNSSNGRIFNDKLILEEFGTTIVASKMNGKLLYTCGNNLRNEGIVNIYDTASKELIFSAKTADAGPCYIELSKNKKLLFIANIQSGSVSSYQVIGQGRSLKLVNQFKLSPGEKFRPHAVKLSPDERFLLVPAINRNTVYVLENNSGKLTLKHEYKLDYFKGPRHITFSHDGKHAYLVNQTGESVSCFNYLPETGELKFIENIQTLEDDFLKINNHISEIKIHPNNRYVYIANRGHDSIALLHRDLKTGKLEFKKTFSSKGNAPWSFDLSDNGQFLVCSNGKTGNIHSYRISLATGELVYTGHSLEMNKRLSSVRIFTAE
ncbi:MAG: lactonase family protein [Lentisphaeraceae bacterium]|nr:lactonase family protein [Lentisphaeraceae bacterium]